LSHPFIPSAWVLIGRGRLAFREVFVEFP
jgi:hypothetical protein